MKNNILLCSLLFFSSLTPMENSKKNISHDVLKMNNELKQVIKEELTDPHNMIVQAVDYHNRLAGVNLGTQKKKFYRPIIYRPIKRKIPLLCAQLEFFEYLQNVRLLPKEALIRIAQYVQKNNHPHPLLSKNLELKKNTKGIEYLSVSPDGKDLFLTNKYFHLKIYKDFKINSTPISSKLVSDQMYWDCKNNQQYSLKFLDILNTMDESIQRSVHNYRVKQGDKITCQAFTPNQKTLFFGFKSGKVKSLDIEKVAQAKSGRSIKPMLQKLHYPRTKRAQVTHITTTDNNDIVIGFDTGKVHAWEDTKNVLAPKLNADMDGAQIDYKDYLATTLWETRPRKVMKIQENAHN